MPEVVLSANERQEAALVLGKYRLKYMCGMGPVLGKMYANAVGSEAGREQFAKATEMFFNSMYFNDASNDGLPQNTRALLGFDIWQSPCRLDRVRCLESGQMLTGFLSGRVNVMADVVGGDARPGLLDFFLDDKDEGGQAVLVYPYDVECVFSCIEQAFMFLRAFWYYVEARVLLHLVEDKHPAGASDALDKYTECRRLLIAPFIHDKFPERQYYSQVNVKKAVELEAFYDKHLFSKVRMIQRKAMMIARVIAGGTRSEEKGV